MNKKTYIVPRQKTIHLDADDLIAQSPVTTADYAGDDDFNGQPIEVEVKAHRTWDEW